MSESVNGKRIIVVGATRGLGRGVASALQEAGASVLAIGRNSAGLESLAAAHSSIDTRRGDAADPVFVNHVLDAESPDAVVLVAGAQPVMRPLANYDWESFSRCWEVDVKATFHWVQGLLTTSRQDPIHLVVFSSGAALKGSPLSGGYAGAKQTQRFICRYAASEAAKSGRALRIQCLLPQLNPNTDLGAAGVRAYAAAAGEDPAEFVAKRFGDPVTPAKAGAAVLELLTNPERSDGAEYLLGGAGLRPLDN